MRLLLVVLIFFSLGFYVGYCTNEQQISQGE